LVIESGTRLLSSWIKKKGLEMKRSISLILALSLILTLTVWISLVRCPEAAHGQDGGDLADQNDVDTVMIALTRLDVNDLILDVNDQALDVNDQTLELRYRIINRSDHDVWICESVDYLLEYGVDFLLEYSSGSGLDYEAYFEEKDQEFLIRRRLDFPIYAIFEYMQPGALYVRLRAGEERVESLSLTLPVRPRCVLFPDLSKGGIKYARRLVVEIGYHTKDLAQIILDLKGSNADPNQYDEVVMSLMSSVRKGEHVLRIKVDGVLIPYEDIPVQYPR